MKGERMFTLNKRNGHDLQNIIDEVIPKRTVLFKDYVPGSEKAIGTLDVSTNDSYTFFRYTFLFDAVSIEDEKIKRYCDETEDKTYLHSSKFVMFNISRKDAFSIFTFNFDPEIKTMDIFYKLKEPTDGCGITKLTPDQEIYLMNDEEFKTIEKFFEKYKHVGL